MSQLKTCTNSTPPWFTGHWRDWHRGHGCDRDDGKQRADVAITEIAQHEANKDTGYLTDAELSFLRARTTSGDTLLIRAIDELKARRATGPRTRIHDDWQLLDIERDRLKEALAEALEWASETGDIHDKLRAEPKGFASELRPIPMRIGERVRKDRIAELRKLVRNDP